MKLASLLAAVVLAVLCPCAPAQTMNFTASEKLNASIRSNFSGLVGMQFTLGNSNLTVNGLGRWCVSGNSQSHTVEILTGSFTTVASASVSMAGCPGGLFTYATLASPVTLTAHTTYYLLSQETYGGDQWYDWNGTSVQNTGVASINGAYYVWSGQTTFNMGGGQEYGPVDFQYCANTCGSGTSGSSSGTNPPAAIISVAITLPAGIYATATSSVNVSGSTAGGGTGSTGGGGTTAHTLILGWSASTSPNVNSYNVYRATSSSGSFSKIGSTTTTYYQDATVSGGTTYYYEVTAVAKGIESADSQQAIAMVP